MFDLSRLTRLITMAVASSAVTWAFAAGAMAHPAQPDTGTPTSSAPAYKSVPGDVNKAPTGAPAFKPTAGDTAKTPDPVQVQRVIDGIGRGKTPGAVPASVPSNDDTGTIALIVAIAAILMALGAVSLTVVRPMRHTAGV
jgi:hypothetical protein